MAHDISYFCTSVSRFSDDISLKNYSKTGIKMMYENKKKGLNAVRTQSFLL
ncbi:hypothetical protein HMPREF9419_0494 [Prevotella nigrescens ATCC 33563]|nr:hypothetical protein HMPREF9419_0494 [Prevotella nigrescens ATCC 33563]